MARTPKTPEQKAAEAAARAAAKAAKAAAASQSSGDAEAPAAEPTAESQAELTLHDALSQLTDDHRMRPHWESSIRKFADNQGIGVTATAEKWRECLKKYGVKLR